MSDQVAAIHFSPTLGAVSSNREQVVALARQAAQWAALVVLPELCTTGFCLTLIQAQACAEPLDGPSVRALRQVSQESGSVIVAGLALHDAQGVLRNAQVVLDSERTVVYTKHHLYGADFNWAAPGATPGAVALTSIGPVGLLICHDIVYPSTVLAVTRQRPRALAFSTAWIGDPNAHGLPESWCIVAQLLAPAPLVAANRGGQEGAVAFDDPSAILCGHQARIGQVGPHAQTVFADLP